MEDFTKSNMRWISRDRHCLLLGGKAGALKKISPTELRGVPTLSVQAGNGEIFIHSSRDPVREAARWAEARTRDTEPHYIVVFGLGLGYHIEALFQKCPGVRRIVVVEADPEIAAAVLAYRDMSTLLRDERFCLISGPYDAIVETVVECLDHVSFVEASMHNLSVMVHRPSMQALREYDIELFRKLEYLNLAYTPRKMFVEEKRKNAEKNADAIKFSSPAALLFGSREGRSVIVVASGPSLDRTAAVIARSPHRPEIIAVDSALAPLRSAGIMPDFVVSVDPQERTAELFRGIKTEREKLVFLPQTNPEVVEMFPAERRFFAFAKDRADAGALEGNEDTDNSTLVLAGTVLITALDLAVRTGADPVALAGADFSFLPGRTHASGSRTGDYEGAYGKLRVIQGLRGEPVLSSDVFYLYLKTVSQYIGRLEGKPTIYNTTPRGAVIENTNWIDMERFIGLSQKRKQPQ